LASRVVAHLAMLSADRDGLPHAQVHLTAKHQHPPRQVRQPAGIGNVAVGFRSHHPYRPISARLASTITLTDVDRVRVDGPGKTISRSARPSHAVQLGHRIVIGYKGRCVFKCATWCGIAGWRCKTFDAWAPDAPHMFRHTVVTTMLDAGASLRDVQIAARQADLRTTMRYNRACENLDRHPNYVLDAYMASGT
jgi:hypothetical protein